MLAMVLCYVLTELMTVFSVDSPTYNNIYLEKSDNSELLLAKNVPADSRVMSP